MTSNSWTKKTNYRIAVIWWFECNYHLRVSTCLLCISMRISYACVSMASLCISSFDCLSEAGPHSARCSCRHLNEAGHQPTLVKGMRSWRVLHPELMMTWVASWSRQCCSFQGNANVKRQRSSYLGLWLSGWGQRPALPLYREIAWWFTFGLWCLDLEKAQYEGLGMKKEIYRRICSFEKRMRPLSLSRCWIPWRVIVVFLLAVLYRLIITQCRNTCGTLKRTNLNLAGSAALRTLLGLSGTWQSPVLQGALLSGLGFAFLFKIWVVPSGFPEIFSPSAAPSVIAAFCFF